MRTDGEHLMPGSPWQQSAAVIGGLLKAAPVLMQKLERLVGR
jgi:hypothetical protein